MMPALPDIFHFFAMILTWRHTAHHSCLNIYKRLISKIYKFKVVGFEFKVAGFEVARSRQQQQVRPGSEYFTPAPALSCSLTIICLKPKHILWHFRSLTRTGCSDEDAHNNFFWRRRQQWWWWTTAGWGDWGGSDWHLKGRLGTSWLHSIVQTTQTHNITNNKNSQHYKQHKLTTLQTTQTHNIKNNTNSQHYKQHTKQHTHKHAPVHIHTLL